MNTRQDNIAWELRRESRDVRFAEAWIFMYVDVRGRRIKIERYRIPESCRKKVSMPMWRPQSIDRCLPLERLQRCSSRMDKSIYFIQWRKKRVEGWVDRVAPWKRASLKETLFRPFLPTTSVEPRMDTFIK